MFQKHTTLYCYLQSQPMIQSPAHRVPIYLLGEPAELHGDVTSGVPDADHHHLLVPPLLGRLVVTTVEVFSLERVQA